ncbi:hypothetical protein [Novosphingobium sp. JCM 18896]|uniref:hypothetical protein n=1 Tax=Novosphingobium sp. JCM 18896 TaxID=2989731 RepID=UPI002222FE42|nr:hypothetical protein [Novosphingobium sp. JCM 18896]MCW1431581.1 hypothetical protein [Novosphingobium sp. JCM 18896]
MSPTRIIRKQLKAIEAELELVDGLRDLAKTEGGRMTEFGRALLVAAKDAEVKQSFMARLLGISPGAVSQHYNK